MMTAAAIITGASTQKYHLFIVLSEGLRPSDSRYTRSRALASQTKITS